MSYFSRPQCNYGSGNIPLYVNVNMKTGETVNTWIDALQAAWSAVQVLFDNKAKIMDLWEWKVHLTLRKIETFTRTTETNETKG